MASWGASLSPRWRGLTGRRPGPARIRFVPFDRADRAIEPVPGGDGIAGGVDGDRGACASYPGVEILFRHHRRRRASRRLRRGVRRCCATISGRNRRRRRRRLGQFGTVAGAGTADSPPHDLTSGKMFDSTTEVAPLDDCQTARRRAARLVATSGASALRAMFEIAMGDRRTAGRHRGSRILRRFCHFLLPDHTDGVAGLVHRDGGVSTPARPN